MQKLRIAASGHSVNYLPHYVATRQGFFDEEGLEVDIVVPEPWDNVLTELADGTAQAALGGIWVPAMFRHRGRDLVPFAQLSARCPLVIVGRQRAGSFTLRQLEDATVLVPGSNGASPGVFLQMLLTEHGIDVAAVSIVQNLADTMLAELFAGGMGDYLLIDPIAALKLADRGIGTVACSLANVGGAVPWSTYYTTRAALEKDRAVLESFTRALDRGLAWVRRQPGEELRPVLTELFSSVDPDRLVQHVDSLRECGMWHTARIDREAYERWQIGLEAAHLVSTAIDYDTFVDERIADAAGVAAPGMLPSRTARAGTTRISAARRSAESVGSVE